MNDTKKTLVLVAEDDRSVREAITKMLASAGFDVLQAIDGLEAFEIFEKYTDKIKLLIFDVVMPKMGGMQAYSAISLLRERSVKPKILYLTAYSQDLFKSINDDEFDYLLKPFHKDEFLVKVEQVLNKKLV
jgi:DNA-binding response OmpR family regulator